VLDDFASGSDVYSKFISAALDEEIHKPTKLDDPSTHSYLTLMRQTGKVAVLGLGFGMGVDKFMVRLRQEKSIAPHMVTGGKLEQAVCATIVHGYRAQFPQIVRFWADLNAAFQVAIRGAKRTVGFLTFERVDGKDVAITLPSGRRLFYRNIRRVPRSGTTDYIGVDGKRHSQERDGFEWVHGNGQRIYGGLLAENVTQAVARDVLVETIFNAEQAGYPIVLHIYDSVVARVPVSKAKRALAFIDASLRHVPEWAPGLVLGSEGHIADNLAK
jgi:DNA polymerase